MGKLSKRCSISALVTLSRWIKALKQWSSFSPSLVLSETSLASFTLLSGWRERRTVSRTSTLTSAVSSLGWLSTCFTWYSGENDNVRILKVMFSMMTNSPFQTRSAQNSRES